MLADLDSRTTAPSSLHLESFERIYQALTSVNLDPLTSIRRIVNVDVHGVHIDALHRVEIHCNVAARSAIRFAMPACRPARYRQYRGHVKRA